MQVSGKDEGLWGLRWGLGWALGEGGLEVLKRQGCVWVYRLCGMGVGWLAVSVRA